MQLYYCASVSVLVWMMLSAYVGKCPSCKETHTDALRGSWGIMSEWTANDLEEMVICPYRKTMVRHTPHICSKILQGDGDLVKVKRSSLF